MFAHLLTLTCPDRPGIVAALAQGLLDIGANIVESAQFGDEATSSFCMRTRFEAPIDDQDVVRVSDAQDPEEMPIAGRDLERVVLARAVKAHAEGRVFLLGGRTVVLS